MSGPVPRRAGWRRPELGFVGIIGGVGLLAAFIAEIPEGLNLLRLILFHAGAIAVAVAMQPVLAATSAGMANLATLPVVVANLASMAWLLAALGRDRPFAGDFGVVGFVIELSVWVAAAWFAALAFRSGTVWRPATAMLGVGSVLAIPGMDRLELTSSASPSISGPIALLGIALHGLAWILLGLWLVGRGWADSAKPLRDPSHG
ncbi:MAG: hypothetical protein WEC14_09305 [Chloroflexota bacterium]